MMCPSRSNAALLGLLVALASSSHAASAAHPAARPTERPIARVIAIAVNGEPLTTDTPPIVDNGRVLVPMRDVFDALGIVIRRAGATIEARLPTGSVRVTVGSSRATIDDRTIALDAPVTDAEGTTYVPLRLLSAAFGAQATYDGRTARVEIVSSYLGRTSAASEARAGGGSDVQGVISAIDRDSNPPALTVVRGGTSRTISITSEAKVWVEDVTIHSQVRGRLDDVRVGDALHAILARDGRVLSVFDYYKSTSGTVAAVTPNAFVLANGRVVTPGKLTEVTLNNAAAVLGDLKVGDYVTVRSNPESGELRQIVGARTLAAAASSATPQPGTPSPTQIASFDLSVTRPLRAGEAFDVTMHGTSGGRASFDIGDLLTALPMRESAPGTYAGRFVIPDRFNVTQVPVYGQLAVGTNAAPRAQAAQTLSAATTPPAIGEVAPPSGQRVNNPRPSIFATFVAPTEIAINVSSVTLEVDGHDVTSAATRTNSFITYSPGVDLPSGPVTVVVKVSDAAGNAATKTWTFTIAR